MKIKESHTYKLLVEGNDDQHVVWALCEKHNVPESFDVIDCESVEKVLKAFEVRLKIVDNNQRIGIVVDADVNLMSRWGSIVSILKKTGKYDCQAIDLPRDGLILETEEEIRALLNDIESDRTERTISITNIDKFGQVICAFANDLPYYQLPRCCFWRLCRNQVL